MNENGVLWTTTSALKRIFSSWKDEVYIINSFVSYSYRIVTNKNKISCTSFAEALSLSCQEIFCLLIRVNVVIYCVVTNKKYLADNNYL